MRTHDPCDNKTDGVPDLNDRQHAPHYLRHLAEHQRAGSVEFREREGDGWIAARTSDVADLEAHR